MMQLHTNGDITCSNCGEVISTGNWTKPHGDIAFADAQSKHFDVVIDPVTQHVKELHCKAQP